MTDAPIRVEVVCPACKGEGTRGAYVEGVGYRDGADKCWPCECSGAVTAPAQPGSLTEAMMQLAEAVVAEMATEMGEEYGPTSLEFYAALARVRERRGV